MARRGELFTFSVTGAKEIGELLEQLPPSIGKGVMRSTLTKAVRPVRDGAKALVENDEFELQKSITISTRLSKRQRRLAGKTGDVVVYVGPSHPKGAHGHLVEFGTGPRYHKTTGKYVGVMPARPFMRPAWDANKMRVLDNIRDDIWQNLLKAVRRLRKHTEAGKLSKSATRFLTGG